MNTGTRRFIVRLIVGLLTFMIGVGAAILVGGVRPFWSSSHARHEGYSGCEHRRQVGSSRLEVPGAAPDMILLKGPHGIRVRRELRDIPPPPPSAADAPIPPGSSRGRR